jgi:predicted anti-sigma-YlaC factor YlaD
MKSLRCPEFDQWLERTPRREIPSSLKEHLESCPECRDRIDRLDPLIDLLAAEEPAPPLPGRQLQEFERTAIEAKQRTQSRRTNLRLIAASLVSLPVIFLINWFWGYLGFEIMQTLFSKNIAIMITIIFSTIMIVLDGLAFGMIPILTGFFRQPVHAKELALYE